MQRYYKLAKTPSEQTKFKKLYYVKGNNWNTEGTLFTTKQLMAVLKYHITTYASIEDLPTGWFIEEFTVSINKSTTIDWFVKHKSPKPIIPGL